MLIWSLITIVIFVIVYGIVIYNDLVKKKNQVEEGWSGIETQLKRRANLIPNLVSTIEGYVDHERETLKEVTDLRTRSLNVSSVATRAETEAALTSALGRLFAVAEAYPQLKANEHFKELQTQLSELENQIQLARRYYNGSVRNLNIMIESFPSNIVAENFNFNKAEFFAVEDPADRAVPKVSFTKADAE